MLGCDWADGTSDQSVIVLVCNCGWLTADPVTSTDTHRHITYGCVHCGEEVTLNARPLGYGKVSIEPMSLAASESRGVVP